MPSLKTNKKPLKLTEDIVFSFVMTSPVNFPFCISILSKHKGLSS